jgi:hypothetical protein
MFNLTRLQKVAGDRVIAESALTIIAECVEMQRDIADDLKHCYSDEEYDTLVAQRLTCDEIIEANNKIVQYYKHIFN